MGGGLQPQRSEGAVKVANTRKHRRELTYEVAKLRGLERFVDPNLDDASAKALATQIRDQAEICLDLLDQYQSSVPGRMWSYAERTCQPLRNDLNRTARHFRAESGEWELRSDERLWGQSWWTRTDLGVPDDHMMDRHGESDVPEAPAGPERGVGRTPVRTDRAVEIVLSGLEFDPDPLHLPADPAQMMTLVTILVGPPLDGGGELFRATLCTPEWIAAQPESTSLMPGGGLLIVRFEDFDEHRVRHDIERFLARIHEESWGAVAKRIREWFPSWEYDERAS
jgi:hypothetical protein